MAGIIAEQALIRQNIALSMIKHAAQQDQAMAKMIDDSVRNAPVSKTNGTKFNGFA